LFFNDLNIYTRAIAIIIFLLITSPVAAHMIGRAAYFDGVPLWKETIRDDLHGHYHSTSHSLEPFLVTQEDSITNEAEQDDFEEEK
jgi:multicomponent Na+:H+ antiporter subunit G